jgi:predicted dehydrogenase
MADMRRFVDEREGHPSELEDWVAMFAEFTNGATGVFESTKLATGRGEGGRSQDYCELNGSDGTLIYYLNRPHELQIGQKGGSQLETIAVPEEFLKIAGSSRDPHSGDPLNNFRYDQDFEFIDAILNERPCQPSFYEGARVQAVIDAAIAATRAKTWTGVSGADIPTPY